MPGQNPISIEDLRRQFRAGTLPPDLASLLGIAGLPGTVGSADSPSSINVSGQQNPFWLTQPRRLEGIDPGQLRERIGFAGRSRALGSDSGDFSPLVAESSSTGSSNTGGLDLGSLSGLLPLLNGNQEQLQGLGPLFQTLLSLQGKGGGNGDPFGLFSGIQL